MAQLPYEQRIIRRHGETWHRAAKPPVWAQHRQEMVDGVSWFKSYQSGVHLTLAENPPLYVLGMLIGRYAGSRAYVDAEVIITSLNGTQNETPTSHPTQRRSQAMTNNINDRRLIGMIFEHGCTVKCDTTIGVKGLADGPAPLFPCTDMSGTQNCWLADFFLPTHLWPEKLPDKKGAVWMVRLEKYNLASQSWWGNPMHGTPPPDDQRNFSVQIRQEQCTLCHRQSPRIFQEFFLCTNNTCEDWWKHNDQVISLNRHLTYTDEFLLARTGRPVNGAVFPAGQSYLMEDFMQWWNQKWLGPNMNQVPVTAQNFTERMSDLLRGFCCPTCGMINCRVRWHEWHCRNTRCGQTAQTSTQTPWHMNGWPPHISIPDVTTLGAQQAVDESALRSQPGYHTKRDLPDFIVHEFILGEECKLAYLVPKPGTNQKAGSSDSLYLDIQRLAAAGRIKLERRMMYTQAGPVLTSHFAANYGREYVYTATVDTVPFDQAEPTIVRATNLVNSWTAPWRTPNDHPANELYLAGYWDGQRMNWHDDGEKGLEDIITTYTLGGQGTFSVRIKKKYNTGTAGSNARRAQINYDPVIPGCVQETARRALRTRLDNGEITQAQWVTEYNTLMHGEKAQKKTLLTLPVNHGYIVIMYGSRTQRYLDHCVNVHTPMRFALTFRHITDEHMNSEDRRQLAKRLAYDVAYDPGEDSTEPEFLDPVGDNPNATGDALPALSPRDSPPQDVDVDGDDDDLGHGNTTSQPRRRGASRRRGSSRPSPYPTANRGRGGTTRTRTPRTTTASQSQSQHQDDDVDMTDASQTNHSQSRRTTRSQTKRGA